MPVLELRDVTKAYTSGNRSVTALHSINLSIEPGEFVGIYGNRRSGRSTLLRIACGAVSPDGGMVRAWTGRTGQPWATPQAPTVVLVDAARLIVPGRSAVDHVAVPLLAAGLSLAVARRAAHKELSYLEILSHTENLVRESAEFILRVALASALVVQPRVVLLDEPTQGLDDRGRSRVLRLLRRIGTDRGAAVVVTAGDLANMAGVDRALALAGGELGGRVAGRSGSVVDLPVRRTVAG